MSGYTTKEVLLSTNDKLKEINDKLEHLKNMTSIESDKRIKSIKYDVHCLDSKKNPELHCHVISNKGLIKNLFIRDNFYSHGKDVGLVVRDNNGNSYVMIDKYNVNIEGKNQEGFNKTADEVLTDEFVRNFLKKHWLYPPVDGLNNSMSLFTDNITIRSVIKNTDYPIFFTYLPYEKKASLSTCKGQSLNSEMIQKLLSMNLDDDNFDEYKKGFIESSKDLNKEIIVPEFSVQKDRVDFSVKEDNKGLYLIKK